MESIRLSSSIFLTANAWTISSTNRGTINGSFSADLDIPPAETTDLSNRVDQLEKEVKRRDTEIRELNERVKRCFIVSLISKCFHFI